MMPEDDGQTPQSEDSYTCRFLRVKLFEAIDEVLPEVLDGLRQKPFELFQHVPEANVGFGFRLIDQLVKYRANEHILIKNGLDLNTAQVFHDELLGWMLRHKLNRLGGWVLDFAVSLMEEWRFYPDEARLGFLWMSRVSSASRTSKRDQPRKFIYSLIIPSQYSHQGAYQQKRAQERIAAEADGYTLMEIGFNPYEVENSEWLPIDDTNTRFNPRMFNGLDDWDPRSGENKEDFVKRVTLDFQKRLRQHVNALDREAKLEGHQQRRFDFALRDAKLVVYRLLKNYKSNNDMVAALALDESLTKLVNGVNVDAQIRNFKKHALIRPYVIKNTR